MANLDLYRCEKDHIRENLNKYTEKAFRLLPIMDKPHILDVGCGTGVPTLKLAESSGGRIIGLDNDETSLKMLRRKIEDQGLDNQVKVINDSIFTMDFPLESFDIIWAEGSVFVMGFEESIKNWRRFLKPDGFIVLHDDNEDKKKKLEMVKKHGYRLINEFELPYKVWWEDYYTPLQELIKEFNEKYPGDSKLNEELNKDQREIDQNFSAVMANSIVIIIQKV
ncbi:MAG TPA: class I SAM-dependent methyltransferase [Methanobacterium sp.]|jgi:ubiquinone/menaquinone biosynthesis C-methylase UbiE|nr:class I SAM-dependent methyltransferase [Methanobacterium sp.]HOI39297.1 class I SAM-dependent methyltransferase [Methanobacterium sp.]